MVEINKTNFWNTTLLWLGESYKLVFKRGNICNNFFSFHEYNIETNFYLKFLLLGIYNASDEISRGRMRSNYFLFLINSNKCCAISHTLNVSHHELKILDFSDFLIRNFNYIKYFATNFWKIWILGKITPPPSSALAMYIWEVCSIWLNWLIHLFLSNCKCIWQM